LLSSDLELLQVHASFTGVWLAHVNQKSTLQTTYTSEKAPVKYSSFLPQNYKRNSEKVDKN